MTDVPMLPSPTPMDKIDGQLIVVVARDVSEWVIDKLSSLENTDYDMNEMGVVLVETLDREWFADSESTALGSQFSDWMARRFGTGESEYQYLVPVFDEVYGIIATRIAALQLKHVGGANHLGISFFQWSGGDLVIRHHPIPY